MWPQSCAKLGATPLLRLCTSILRLRARVWRLGWRLVRNYRFVIFKFGKWPPSAAVCRVEECGGQSPLVKLANVI